MINVNLLYPVGSIYITVNSKNPSDIFGGTWERIKGKMLVGVDEEDDDFKQSGKTGGEKEVTLTSNEIPPLSVNLKGGRIGASGTQELVYWNGASNDYIGVGTTDGGGQPHNNMPPYFTAYIWYRTA